MTGHWMLVQALGGGALLAVPLLVAAIVLRKLARREG
jgi:hypothetical protein